MPLDVKNYDLENSPEAKVVEDVIKEINRIGEDQNKTYEQLRKEWEQLKSSLENQDQDDAVIKEKVTKLTEDISTRQNALDDIVKKQESNFQERMDLVEVALKRLPKGESGKDVEDVIKEATDFQFACMAARLKDDKGASYRRTKDMEVDVKAFQEYKKSFEEYLRIDEKAMSPESFKALSVGVDPDGGYTVTPAMASRIITLLYETDPMRELAGSESISTGAIEWMVDTDEAGAEWEDETTVTTEDTTPQMKKKRIVVHALAARPTITQTLIEDSAINIEQWLAKKIADKFARTESASFITGDGIGKPRGILTYDNGTSWGQIQQTGMGHATALTADGFISVKYSLIEQYLNRGTWLMRRSTVAAAMKLKDGAGNYLFMPGSLPGDRAATLVGQPLRMSTTMPAIAANALAIAIADWGEAYMIVDRLGITVQRDPYTQKPFVEFYSRKRVGGDVVNYQAIKIGKIST